MVTVRKTLTMSPRSYLLTVLLVTWCNPSVDGIELTLSPPDPKVGDDVTFIVSGVDGNIRFSDWYKGTTNSADNQIFRFTNSGNSTVPGKQYFEAAKAFANGSMLITNVRKAYEGFYTVDIQTNNLLQGKVELTVRVLLVTWCNPSVDGIELTLSPPDPKVGDDVTFIVSGVDGNIRFSDWYKGTTNSAANQIFRFTNSANSTVPGKQHFEAAKAFANGSMLITNVLKAYEGFYTVDIQTNNLLQGKVELTVRDGILSGGAIAGIVIAVLVVVIGAIILIYCFCIKKQSSVNAGLGSSKDGSQTRTKSQDRDVMSK